MKNADNLNDAVDGAVEQKVGTRPVFAVAGPYFGTRATDCWLCRDGFDVLPELAE
jgi:hypothetical protein